MKRITLSILLAGTMLSQVASAQSSSTPIIGYAKKDIPAGASAVANVFTAKKDFQGAALSIVGGSPNSTITLTGTPLTANALTLHYVEILSGANAGRIFDVVSNTASSIVIAGDVTSLGLAGTETVCVRKHATLQTVFPAGNGLAPNEDLVIVIDETGGEIQAINTGTNWEDVLNPGSLLNDTIIYPGQGVIVVANAPRTVTLGGNENSYVKSGATHVSLYPGIPNLVGGLNPLIGNAPADQVSALQLGLNGLIANEDLAILTTTDGALETTFNVLFDGTNLVDALNPTTILDAQPIRNGDAVILVPNSEHTISLPQTHP